MILTFRISVAGLVLLAILASTTAWAHVVRPMQVPSGHHSMSMPAEAGHDHQAAAAHQNHGDHQSGGTHHSPDISAKADCMVMCMAALALPATPLSIGRRIAGLPAPELRITGTAWSPEGDRYPPRTTCIG